MPHMKSYFKIVWKTRAIAVKLSKIVLRTNENVFTGIDMNILIDSKKIQSLYFDSLKERYQFNNCYFYQDKLERWLENNKVVCYSLNCGLILLVREAKYTKIYFMLNDFKELKDLVSIMDRNLDNLVIEIVVKGKAGVYNLNSIFSCRKILQYTRLRSSGKIVECDINKSLYCTQNDFQELRRIMDYTFCSIGDHIPSDEELQKFIESKNIIGIWDSNVLAGFIIFEDTKNTSYIRMICVDNAFQGRGLGDVLMSLYFSVHKGFKSFTLWCRVDNDAAMYLYTHKWNYKEENLYNYIYVI